MTIENILIKTTMNFGTSYVAVLFYNATVN